MSKQFTRNEVESSNGKDKTLIIIHDKVYDVASFLNEHPGGEEILLDHGGKESSDDFDDVGHSKDAFDLMKNYLVGELVESERSNKTPKLGWSSTAAKQQKTQKNDQGVAPWLLIAGVVGFLAVMYLVYL